MNNLIQKNLNRLNLKEKKKIISQFISLKRVIIGLILFLILGLIFLSLPNLYTKPEVQNNIKNQLLDRYDVKFKFSTDMKYDLFPWPNYKFENIQILSENNKKLADIKNLKINLEISNFFSSKNLKIKEIFLAEAKFNLYKKDLNFFFNLLNNDFSKSKIKILNSYIFLKNELDEVLLINKIKKMEYSYNFNKNQNTLSVKNEIFNIPYSLEIYKDKIEKKIFSKLNINILRSSFQTEYNYGEAIKKGFIDIINNKNKSKINFSLNKEKLIFELKDKMNDINFNYNGIIDLKPFFLDFSGKIKKIDIKYFINSNSILQQFLKTNVLNNENLNISSKINAEKILPYQKFINLFLNFRINEGLIDIDDSKFTWYDHADFEILNSLIYLNANNLILDGRMKIKIRDYDEIYKFFQTPRNFRKEIKNIEFVFNYNFDQSMINIVDMKIDGQDNRKVVEILKKMVFQDNNLQNKIYFKNLINKAIKAYSG